VSFVLIVSFVFHKGRIPKTPSSVVVIGELGDHARDAATGVGDPDIERAECSERAVAQALVVGATGDVGGDGDRTLTETSCERFELAFAARCEHRLAATCNDELGEREADASGAPVMTTTLSFMGKG
jgi:hypothetical protein